MSKLSMSTNATSKIALLNDKLSATFAALSDPTRRAMLLRLGQGEASVNELAAPFKMSLPAISKHIKVLERAGLLSKTINAQQRLCKLNGIQLKQAVVWIDQFAIDSIAVQEVNTPDKVKKSNMKSAKKLAHKYKSIVKLAKPVEQPTPPTLPKLPKLPKPSKVKDIKAQETPDSDTMQHQIGFDF